MIDKRIEKLAKILVDYSIKVRKNDVIMIYCTAEAQPLVMEVYKRILKKGALPRLSVTLPGQDYNFFKYSSEGQLKMFPELSMEEVRKSAGHIFIRAASNTKELTTINSRKIALWNKTVKPIQDLRLKKDNWVLCRYPTAALAQDAEMSLEEFEDFAYNATNQDWAKEEKKQEKLKKILDKGKEVRIIGEETDITLNIEGRTAIKCCGHRNIPDGEVYLAPVETKVEGKILFSFPAIYNGKEVENVRLEFVNGRVVKDSASKNEIFLKEMLNVDEGAKYVGELGFGTNCMIRKFTKQILFDEKIGGTIHLALGNAYKEGGGRNSSAIHWDMVKDLRKKGEIYIDNKLIQKNGKFLI